jgi:signal peptidase II
VLVTLVAVVVLAVAAMLLGRTRSRPVALFLAAVVGGAAGNLADRLFRSPGFSRGAVVDWIHLAGYPPTLNVADVAIRLGTIGALAAALGAWSHASHWRTRLRVPFRSGPDSAEDSEQARRQAGRNTH